MPRAARVPRQLSFLPFRGSAAVADGLLTRRMLEGRTWRRMLPDVYVHHSAVLDHRAWCDAVALALPPGAAIGGRSAAYLWSVDLLSPDAPVTVVVPRTGKLRPHPMLAISYATLAPDDVTRFGGVPVTTALRTGFDLGRRPPLVDAVIAVDALAHRRLFKLDELRGLAAARRGWPGTRLLDEVLSLAEPRTESPMETRLRLLLISHGLPRPVAQYDVHDAYGRFIGRVDFAYPKLRLAVEYEGDHHRERVTFRRDLARVNALREAGWTVLRLTADDVLRHPGRIIRQMHAAATDRRQRD